MKGIIIDLTNANELEIEEFMDFKRNHNFDVYEIKESVFQTVIFNDEEIEQYKNLKIVIR